LKNSQRRLVVASLLLLAIASATYCLDYDERDLYRIDGGEVFALAMPSVPAAPVIGLGEERVAPFGLRMVSSPGVRVDHVRVTGLFPRPGMSFSAAVLGGLLLPSILFVAACFLTLGLPPTRMMRSYRTYPWE
jgi:hypothetical protein